LLNLKFFVRPFRRWVPSGPLVASPNPHVSQPDLVLAPPPAVYAQVIPKVFALASFSLKRAGLFLDVFRTTPLGDPFTFYFPQIDRPTSFGSPAPPGTCLRVIGTRLVLKKLPLAFFFPLLPRGACGSRFFSNLHLALPLLRTKTSDCFLACLSYPGLGLFFPIVFHVYKVPRHFTP